MVLTVGMGVSLLPALKIPFLLLSCLVQPGYEGFHFVLLCRVLSSLAVVSRKPAPLLKRKWSGIGSGEEGRWWGE